MFWVSSTAQAATWARTAFRRSTGLPVVLFDCYAGPAQLRFSGDARDRPVMRTPAGSTLSLHEISTNLVPETVAQISRGSLIPRPCCKGIQRVASAENYSLARALRAASSKSRSDG